MTDLLDELPADLMSTTYDGHMAPGHRVDLGLRQGANCQRFAYAVLRRFGIVVPPWCSSELWDDTERSVTVDAALPLDLVLFGPTGDAWGAHVGVAVDGQRTLHLCREVGTPTVWIAEQFDRRDRYHVVVGIKRLPPSAVGDNDPQTTRT